MVDGGGGGSVRGCRQREITLYLSGTKCVKVTTRAPKVATE